MDYEDKAEQPKKERKPRNTENVKLNKGGVTIFRPENQAEKYEADGWKVIE